MATAAFKSNTKRSNSTNEKQKNPTTTIRRSLSVNAVSRRSIDNNNNNEELFLNKRDNPLYWATGGSPPADKNDSQTHSSSQVVALSGSERGRSIQRNSDVKIDNGRRRSLSRVGAADTGNGRRGRSVSRPNFESEAEHESRVSITYGGRSSSIRPFSRMGKVPVTDAKASDRRSSHLSRHPSVGSSLDSQVSNMEDMVSTSSLSEAEEKTIKAVYEQMKSLEGNNSRKQVASSEIYETVRSEVRRAIADIQDDLQDAIRRNTTGALASADVTDISTKLINPGGVELVFDIRREYAKELEEAQERARKLRSDLAIEEHRKQELSRILKETLPEPKTSSSHRSRLGRKSSSERKKMSKRLTDEAMSYFDECVSISTFDSSDFSAAEDLSVNSALTNTPTTGAVTGPNHWINQQISHGDLGSNSVIGSSSNESVIVVTPDTERDRKFRFSFGHKPTENIELQHDLKTYIKTLEKDTGLDGILIERSRDNYSLPHAYNLLEVKENLLFDKVLSRNRQESGSVHLCGGVVIPFLPLNHL